MRTYLANEQIHPAAQKSIQSFHPEIVEEIKSAIKSNEWVVVGMAGNPFCKKARVHIENKGLPVKYIEYGSYFSKWKQRLAIKLWSGWPTYPQVFHKGQLIGGYQDLQKYLP